jgi:hypothetical protein
MEAIDYAREIELSSDGKTWIVYFRTDESSSAISSFGGFETEGHAKAFKQGWNTHRQATADVLLLKALKNSRDRVVYM